MVSEQPSKLDAGEAALEKAGFQIEERERVTLGYAPVEIYARLVSLPLGLRIEASDGPALSSK